MRNRTIKPPTACDAFRVRVDHEDDEGLERPLLGTAGEEAMYLWDLEDESRVETIKVDLESEGDDRIKVSPNTSGWKSKQKGTLESLRSKARAISEMSVQIGRLKYNSRDQ
jgi:hypothetical protein